MIIKEVNNNIGTFGGTYNSAVGEAEKEYISSLWLFSYCRSITGLGRILPKSISKCS